MARLARICLLAVAAMAIAGCGGDGQGGGGQDGQSEELTLSPVSGEVGTEVTWSPSCGDDTAALIEFGPVGIGTGTGATVFEVPPLEPGVYEVRVWCGAAEADNLLGTVQFTVT